MAQEKQNATMDAFDFTPIGIVVKPGHSPAFGDWEAVGSYLSLVDGALQWWVGDWLNIGEERFGEQYAQAIDATGFKLQTLQQYAWVAKKVPPERRTFSLSFSHYREVADLDPDQQLSWLQQASAEKWSSKEFRSKLRIAKRPEGCTLWVVVEAHDLDDQKKLVEKFVAEGRAVKTVVGRVEKSTTVAPKTKKGKKSKKASADVPDGF